MKFEGTKD